MLNAPDEIDRAAIAYDVAADLYFAYKARKTYDAAELNRLRETLESTKATLRAMIRTQAVTP